MLIGRVAIDFNPVDYFIHYLNVPFKSTWEVSGKHRSGYYETRKESRLIGKVSDDQFGDYVVDFFDKEGIDISHITRCTNGEKLGLTFEILSREESSISDVPQLYCGLYSYL